MTELGWRGLKFGVHLVFAAQDFAKAVVGRVRDQASAAVCFRVRNAITARDVGCADAAQIPESRPGLAVTDRWGPVQTYYLDKSLLIEAGQTLPTAALTDMEHQLVQHALAQAGKVTLGSLRSWGVGKNAAARLLNDWRLRGWVAKDPARNNAHFVTDKLVSLLGQETGKPGKDQETWGNGPSIDR